MAPSMALALSRQLDGFLNCAPRAATDDRLANGWLGPPGPLGNADLVFAMTVKVSES